MEFGERLRKVRMTRKMTQTEVAALTGMANTYISDLENGRKGVPPGESIARLADVLNTSADYLLGRSENMDSSPATLPESLAERREYLARQFRVAGYPEEAIAAIMYFLTQIPTNSDENPTK